MRRTGAITQKVPTFSSDDYRTFMIGDFKGIDKSVNPFNAIKSSAEECLNLYVDDEGTLTTRPRLDCQSDIVGDELPWNPAEDAIRNSFEFDYNGAHYHAITTNQRRSNEKTFWGLSSDFITWEGFVDDGGNTVSELFNNGDVLYAIIRNGIYTTTIDFTTHKISFTKALAYVPTTGTYDAASSVRVIGGEQENLLTNKFKTEVFWNPTSVQNKDFTNIDFETIKNDYYNGFTFLKTPNNVLIQAGNFKVYEKLNKIVGIDPTNKSQIFVWDTSGNIIKTYLLTDSNISQVDFDYTSDDVLYASYIYHDTAADKYILKIIETTKTTTTTILHSEDASDYNTVCCYIPSKAQLVVGFTRVDGSEQLWLLDPKAETHLIKAKILSRIGLKKLYWIESWDKLIYFATLTDSSFKMSVMNLDDWSTLTRTYFNNYDVRINIKSFDSGEVYMNWKTKTSFITYQLYYDKTHLIESAATNGNANFSDGTGYTFRYTTSPNKLTIEYNSRSYYSDTIVSSHMPLEAYLSDGFGCSLCSDQTLVDSEGCILKYNASTRPLLTIQETSKETSEITLEHVGRFNNNYVYWSTKSNKVYYTANNNPLYIPKSFYDDYGDDTPVTGVMRISDSYLAVLKQDATYLAWFDSETGYFYANELRTEKGNIAVAQAIVCNYSNLPVVINTDGFWGLGQSTSVNYQDTVYSSLSDALRVELQKLDLTKCKTHNHKYLTYFAVPNGDSTTIYVLDNRIQMWFKWVIPIDLKFFAEYEDYTYIYTATSVFKLDPYTAHTNGDLNDAWYADTVNAVGSTKHIPWLWVSQPLYLGTLNYKKRIRYMKFLFDNKYESENVTMRYGFLSYKQSERPTKLREYTSPFTRNTFSNEITGITKQVATLKTKKIRPYIPSFDFIQIILRSNNDSDEFEDADGNIITPTLNDKVGLIGLTINYILQEG